MKHFTMNQDTLNSATTPILPRELSAVHELAHDDAGRLYSVRMRELFASLHVEMSAVEALAALRLAGDLESTPRNITGLVDHLERDGLVERVPDPDDRRSVRAKLTEAGRVRIEAIWKEGLEHQFEVVEGFSKDDLAQLRHLCLKLVESARKELGK